MDYKQKVVDLHSTKKFEPHHLDIHNKLVNPELLPEWYKSECEGGLLPDPIEYDGTEIRDDNEIDTGSWLNTQPARSSGANPKEQNIYFDMDEYGYKLGEVPAFTFRVPLKNNLIYINGKTRNKVLTKFKHENRIVAIFKVRDGYTQEQARDAISLMGPYLNSLNSPAGDVLEQDIIQEAKFAIQERFIQPNFEEIKARLLKSSGKGKFTDDSITKYAWRVYHQYHKRHEAFDWSKNSDGKEWLQRNKFKDITTPTRFIRYKLVSYSTLSKNITDIADVVTSNEFLIRDDAELRVVFHSGELTGRDFKECYENRIIEAFKGTTQRLYNIGDAFFNGSKPKENKVKLYGAIPALAKVDGKPFHDMKKLVKFQKDSNLLKGGFLYQMEDYQK